MKNGNDYGADLQRIVGPGAKVRSTPEGFVVDLECHHGHIVTETVGRQKLPPEAVNRRLANRGWTTGKRLCCPDHNRKEEPPMSMPSPARDFAAEAEASPLSVAAAIAKPTMNALAMRRAVIEGLQIAYDADRHAYTGGYTDDRIATETGAPVEFVRKFREENFGPLDEPEELKVFARRLDRFASDLAEVERNLKQRHAAEQMAIDEAKRGVDDLRRELAGIAKKGGWA